jgi:hypothetical protein
MEMPLVLAQILQNFRLTLAPGHKVVEEGALSLKQRNGALMTVHRLEGDSLAEKAAAEAEARRS